MKIVTVLKNDKVIGRLPLDVACDIEGWDYNTADFGLDFTADFGDVSRESRTDENGNTVTMEWKVQ